MTYPASFAGLVRWLVALSVVLSVTCPGVSAQTDIRCSPVRIIRGWRPCPQRTVRRTAWCCPLSIILGEFQDSAFRGRILSGVASPQAGPLLRPPRCGCDTLLALASRLREQPLATPPAPDGSAAPCRGRYSHSIVAGGLPEMSYTTRLMPRTSLMMRLETLPSRA